MADLKKRTSALADRVTRQPAAPRLTTGDAGVRAAAGAGGDRGSRRAVARGSRRTRPAPAPEPVEQRPVIVGDRVAVGGLGLEGVARGDSRQAGRNRRARQAAARRRSKDLRLAGQRGQRPAAPAQVRVNVDPAAARGPARARSERHRLHGRRGARARGAVPRRNARDRSEYRARVHGHGTGQLQRAIAEPAEDPPAGGAASTTRRRTRAAAGHGVELKDVDAALSRSPSSTICICTPTSCRWCRTTCRSGSPARPTRDSARSTARRRRRSTSTARRASSTASAAASAATCSSSSSCTRRSASPTPCRMLAQRFGMPVPELARRRQRAHDAAEREALLKVHEVAAAWFRAQLATAAGARARQQLARPRHRAQATAERLGLGFAPPSREALKAHLLQQGFRAAAARARAASSCSATAATSSIASGTG